MSRFSEKPRPRRPRPPGKKNAFPIILSKAEDNL